LQDLGGEGEAAACGLDINVEELGGGNPKVCFINYKLMQLKRRRGSLTQAQTKAARTAAVREYDEHEAIKQRWARIFSYVLARRKQKKENPVAAGEARATATEDPHRCLVWSETLQVADQPCAGPVSELVLAEVKGIVAPNAKQLAELAQDDTPYRITSGEQRPQKRVPSIWGCGGELKNVCKAEVSAENLLPRFDTLRIALNQYIDGLGKDTARAVGNAFMLSTQTGEGPRCTWLLLGWASYQPKFQVYVQCGLAGAAAAADGMATAVPEVPYDVDLLSRPSRLCCDATVHDGEAPFLSLHHVTSDELAHRLARVGEQ